MQFWFLLHAKPSPKTQQVGELRGWPLWEETRPVLPQMVPTYLTSGSRTNCRCLGPHLDFLIRSSREEARRLCFHLASQARFVIRREITRREEHGALGRRPPAWSRVPVRAGVSVLL